MSASGTAAGVNTSSAGWWRFQTNLIYLPNHPEGSREHIALPSEFGMPDYDEITVTAADRVRLRAYAIRRHGYMKTSSSATSLASSGTNTNVTNGTDSPPSPTPLQSQSSSSSSPAAAPPPPPHGKVRRKKDPSIIADHTILYFHGNAGNMGHRLPVAKVFYDLLRTNVVLLSYRGYGRSEGVPSEAGVKLDSQAILDWIKSHKDFGKTKVVVYGQSFGGAVAIDLVSRNPDKIHALIVENTYLSIPKLIPSVLPIASPFSFLCLHVWNSEAAIAKIPASVPILLLSGAQDTLIPPHHVSGLAIAARRARRKQEEQQQQQQREKKRPQDDLLRSTLTSSQKTFSDADLTSLRWKGPSRRRGSVTDDAAGDRVGRLRSKSTDPSRRRKNNNVSASHASNSTTTTTSSSSSSRNGITVSTSEDDYSDEIIIDGVDVSNVRFHSFPYGAHNDTVEQDGYFERIGAFWLDADIIRHLHDDAISTSATSDPIPVSTSAYSASPSASSSSSPRATATTNVTSMSSSRQSRQMLRPRSQQPTHNHHHLLLNHNHHHDPQSNSPTSSTFSSLSRSTTTASQQTNASTTNTTTPNPQRKSSAPPTDIDATQAQRRESNRSVESQAQAQSPRQVVMNINTGSRRPQQQELVVSTSAAVRELVKIGELPRPTVVVFDEGVLVSKSSGAAAASASAGR